MNQQYTWIVFGTILVVAGMVGGYGLSKSFFVGTESVQPMTNAGFITGHIELVAKDKDGNIKAYRQTDNLITNNGQNCAAKALFSVFTANTGGLSNATNRCVGGVTKPFTVIAIGTGSGQVNKDNTQLTTESSGNGLTRGQIDTAITWTNSTGSGTSNSGVFARALLQKTFTLTAGSATVTESGLFNDTSASASGMFARQTFTGIGLTTVGDALTIKWTIDIGGTTTIS